MTHTTICTIGHLIRFQFWMRSTPTTPTSPKIAPEAPT
jgi:hypothetical protein